MEKRRNYETSLKEMQEEYQRKFNAMAQEMDTLKSKFSMISTPTPLSQPELLPRDVTPLSFDSTCIYYISNRNPSNSLNSDDNARTGGYETGNDEKEKEQNQEQRKEYEQESPPQSPRNEASMEIGKDNDATIEVSTMSKGDEQSQDMDEDVDHELDNKEMDANEQGD